VSFDRIARVEAWLLIVENKQSTIDAFLLDMSEYVALRLLCFGFKFIPFGNEECPE